MEITVVVVHDNTSPLWSVRAPPLNPRVARRGENLLFSTASVTSEASYSHGVHVFAGLTEAR